MKKKVLIALDYDPTAGKVAAEGFALAKAMGAEITLLHVVADATYYSSVQYSPVMGLNSFGTAEMLQSDSVDEIKKAALRYLENTKKHLGDEAVHTRVEEGDFAASILEVAAGLPADIIVMGTHSRRGLDKILMGSVAEQVLHQTTTPVFIIPTRKRE